MKKKSLLLALIIVIWAGGVLASPINWTGTITPIVGGVTIFEDSVTLGTPECFFQTMGEYSATFEVIGGGVLDVFADLWSWDSEYFDQFYVKISSQGNPKFLWEWGGQSWTDRTEEFFQDHLFFDLSDLLGESVEVVLGMRTKCDRLFPSGGTFDVSYTAAPVPEPTTMLLFGAGLAGLAAIGRKKNQR